MSELSDFEISVDRLMHEIRETLAEQRRNAGSDTLSSRRSSLTTSSRVLNSSFLSLQPEFRPSPDDRYYANDLLKYHGADFVRNAYLALLKREPDEGGLAKHLKNLESGQHNKVDVLESLRSSPEGKKAGVELAGLRWHILIRRLGRLPVVGYLIQIMIAAARLPQLHQHQRQSEFYVLAQQQRIVDHHNQVQEEVADIVTKSRAESVATVQKLTNQQQAMELLLQQQEGIADRLLALETILTAAREQLDQSAEAFTRQLEEHTQQLLQGQKKTDTEFLRQERRLTLLLEAARDSHDADDTHLSRLMVAEEGHLLDQLYASFEDRFRGSREEIKSRLQVYLPLVKNARVSGDVLDIGCGRGEWLEILKGESVAAQGVDHNRVFVEQCREMGLDVVEGDALIHLRSLPDDSLNVITSFHLVEHLSFETLIKLLDEIVRTLKSGGLLVLETPNPENFIVGSCSFYADPTHRNPIPPATLQFLLESRDLIRVEIMRLRPLDTAKLQGDTEIISRFNEYFCSAPDYGIIGWKV